MRKLSVRPGVRPRWEVRVVRRAVLRLLLASVTGGIAGLVLYSLTRVTSRSLFAVTGALAAVVALLASEWYRKAARLTEVKVTIPQLSELTFAVNNDSRQVAWHMFVETVTRVSTQPLADDEGVVRASRRCTGCLPRLGRR